MRQRIFEPTVIQDLWDRRLNQVNGLYTDLYGVPLRSGPYNSGEVEPSSDYVKELEGFMFQRQPLTERDREKNLFSQFNTQYLFEEEYYLSLAPEVEVIGPDRKGDLSIDAVEYFPTVFRYIIYAADEALRSYTEDPEENPLSSN
ncbi:MAG: hypothetical protein R2827_04505 [Bdellovibrionales bacterium]